MFVKAVDQIVSGDHRSQALAYVHTGVGTVLATRKSTGIRTEAVWWQMLRVCELTG